MNATDTPLETLLVSTSSAEPWSIGIHNPDSGSPLWSYKGTEMLGVGASAQVEVVPGRTMGGGEYLVVGVKDKSLLNFVGLQKKDSKHVRCVLPGVANCVAFDPSGAYCCVGIEDKIYVWIVADGLLVNVHQAHYQPVTQLQFTDNGFYLVSAGKDGVVQAWAFVDMLQPLHPLDPLQPVHRWQCHALAVSSLHVTGGGVRGRVVSGSLDKSVKVHSLYSGNILLSMACESQPSAVSADGADTRVFIGSVSGNIHCLQLNTAETLANRRELFLPNQQSVDSSQDRNVTTLVGHSSRVTSVSVSLDGFKLASGAEDSNVRIWDMISGRCLSLITVNGPVTVCRFIATPKFVSSPGLKSNYHVVPFQKQIAEKITDITVTFPDASVQSAVQRLTADISEQEQQYGPATNDVSQVVDPQAVHLIAQLQSQLAKANKANKELYQFAIQKLVSKN